MRRLTILVLFRDGVLVCPAGGGKKFMTEGESADFVLRFGFRLEPDANNGAGIRATRTP